MILAVFCMAGAIASSHDAAGLFAQYKDRIFQVRLIDIEADKKSALGTGFLVAHDGLIATNYHVVSGLIDKPDKYRLEYLDEQGEKGDLTLQDVDVINDLALLKAEDLALEPLAIPEDEPEQGDTIYSLGNPYDIGFVVIPGTYNGLEKGSYYKKIHFSGSINAGMSGGPVLDANGGVVGVNVSSAGNQISFLVPADALSKLIGEWRNREMPISDFKLRIRDQLVANQEDLVASILGRIWSVQELGDGTVVGELEPFVKCWGGSNDDDDLVQYVSSSCQSNQSIFLAPSFSTGVISYQFFWLDSNGLSSSRFLSYYESLFDNFIPDNVAGEDDVGNFACDERFVTDSEQNVDKTVFCVRSYKDYESLYDALYLRGSVDETGSAFVSHFTLAGVQRNTAEAFLQRFQSVVRR